jgi:hypothetical protein
MAAKKSKPKEINKKDVVQIQDENKQNSEKMTTVDNVYNKALTGLMLTSPDRIATARALEILRSIEIRKEPSVEKTVQQIYLDCKVSILKTLLKAVLENNLRFIDVPIIMDMIANDSHMLSVWEYENLEEADDLLNENSLKIKTGLSSMDLFNSLGISIKDTNNEEEEDDPGIE